jgi:hypothetical protein
MDKESRQSEREYLAAQEQLFASISAGQGRSSLVPMRASYVNVARCLSIVAFPSSSLAHQISDELIPAFTEIDPHHHYYPAASLHLTIKGIRAAASPAAYSDREAGIAVEVLRHLAPRLRPLEFTLRGVARFPSSLIVRAFGTTAFRDTVHMLDDALRDAGIATNKVDASMNVFIGNMTVCRFTTEPSARLLDCVRSKDNSDLGRFTVDTLALVACDEVCSPESRLSYASVQLSNSKSMQPTGDDARG